MGIVLGVLLFMFVMAIAIVVVCAIHDVSEDDEWE